MTRQFLIPEELKREYSKVKAKYLREGHILAISECPSSTFLLPDQEKLTACGVEGCSAIEYHTDMYHENDPGEQAIAGRHIGVQTEKGRLSVILIRDDYPSEFSPEFVTAYKICVFLHELGHADDFHAGRNFNHSKRVMRPKEAEAYADWFARKQLLKIPCTEIVEGKKIVKTLWDWYSFQFRERRYAS